MKQSKKLICFFSFTLFAIMLGTAPRRALAEELQSPEEQIASDEASAVPEGEQVSSAGEALISENEEQAASDEAQAVPEEGQISPEQQPCGNEVTAVPTEEGHAASVEALADSPSVFMINPSVYVDPSTGIATASVSTMFSGAAQAQITIRLEQLRDGEWIILGESIHRETSSPAQGYYTRTWPVDHGYYYRGYAIISLQDADRNVLLKETGASHSVYY